MSISRLALNAYKPSRPAWSGPSRKVLVSITISVLVSLCTAISVPTKAAGGPVKITMMEVGDHHGNMVSRPNLRPGDSAKSSEGGLARMATVIKRMREKDPDALLFNCGDTLQGSAEAIYTSGGAMVEVLDTFGINGYAPGNWDWLYGKDRVIELFGDGRWNVVTANAYHADTGKRIFPAYRVLEVKGLKVGIIGMTAARGLPAVPTADVGLIFTNGKAELEQAIDQLRNDEHVDVVVLLSELGLAKNTLLVDQYPGVDVVFSSDMHEETPTLIVTPVNHVLAAEIGWGGSRAARITLTVEDGVVTYMVSPRFARLEQVLIIWVAFVYPAFHRGLCCSPGLDVFPHAPS